MGILSSLIRAFSAKPVKVQYRPGKVGAINAWKAAKKARGNWVPHDQWVQRKRKK
jgi:hypothetical protein